MSTPLRDGAGLAVMTTGGAPLGPEPVSMSVAFGAPDGDTVDVLVPSVGYVEDVPVVAADDADADAVVPLADLTDSSADQLTGRVAPLDSYTESLAGAVRTRTQAEEVTVAIAADVLLAPDSAELGPEADAALSAAGAQVAR